MDDHVSPYQSEPDPKRQAGGSYDSTITSFEAEMAAADVPDPDPVADALTASAAQWNALRVVVDKHANPQLSARIDAAYRLIINHEMVLRDITDTSPHTQLQLARVDPSQASVVDQALRELARRLLGRTPGASEISKEDPSAPSQAATWALAATFIDGRIQSAPNERPGRSPDMSPASAAEMRTFLRQLWWRAYQTKA